MAIARILLDKFHPMKHVHRPYLHPLCWCGIRHFEVGNDVFIDHQRSEYFSTKEIVHARKVAKAATNDGNRGARTGKVEQGE